MVTRVKFRMSATETAPGLAFLFRSHGPSYRGNDAGMTEAHTDEEALLRATAVSLLPSGRFSKCEREMRSTEGVGMSAGTGVTRKEKNSRMVVCLPRLAAAPVGNVAACLGCGREWEKNAFFRRIGSREYERSWLANVSHIFSKKAAGRRPACLTRLNPPTANVLPLVFLSDVKETARETMNIARA